MDHEDDKPEEKVLKGDDAIALWKKGREKWNAWVYTHLDWGVDFSYVDFSQHAEPGEDISFEEYRFPKGMVRFDYAQFSDWDVIFRNSRFGGDVFFNAAQFGDGDINFFGVQFNDGSVNFIAAQFGEGDVDFSGATFGKGNVDFAEVNFGKGDVSFNGAEFGDGHVYFTEAESYGGNVDFYGAQFGEGDVFFKKVVLGNGLVFFNCAQFGEGDVHFDDAQFGEGHVFFNGARFGEGRVDFNHTDFGKGTVNFSDAQFGDGSVDFRHAQFGEGRVFFNSARFGEGSIDFHGADLTNVKQLSFNRAKWQGGVHFHPKIGSKTEEINFSSASIGWELSLGAFTTSCVIDLRHTKLNHPIDLDRVDINYRTKKHPRRLFWLRYPVALNQDVSTCFRRLKKLAKDADDHERALDFYAKEMRSSYGRELTGWPLFLYLLYDKVSDYGRSLSIPTQLLFTTIGLYGVVYLLLSAYVTQNVYSVGTSFERLGSALTFSLAHALPFYFGSREANADTLKTLFPTNPPDYLHWLTISQGMVCGVLLFLIALALRNRFRS